jgi:Ankyrin repeats (3 copies)/Ankyrin repeat
MSAMHKAARENSIDEMQQMIVSGKYDVNEKDGLKRTPLHLACWAGHLDMVKLLLRARAKIDALASDNFTCLHFASKPDIVRELVKRDKHLLAARVTKGNKTALHMAIQKGNVELVACLLDLGADLTAKTSTGQTCMDLAKNDEIYALLKAKFEERIARQAASKGREEGTDHAGAEDEGMDTVEVETAANDSGARLVSGTSTVHPVGTGDASDRVAVGALGSRTADDAGLTADHNSNSSASGGVAQSSADSDAAMGPPPAKKAKTTTTVKLSHLEQDDEE